MLGWLFRSSIRRAYEREFDHYLSFIDCGSEEEAAGLFVMAQIARHYLSRETVIKRPFPTAEFNGEVVLAEHRKDLVLWRFEVVLRQKSLHKSDDVRAKALSGGVNVWAFSALSLIDPYWLSRGRHLWRHLSNASQFYDVALADLKDMGILGEDIDPGRWIPSYLMGGTDR